MQLAETMQDNEKVEKTTYFSEWLWNGYGKKQSEAVEEGVAEEGERRRGRCVLS